MAVVKPERVTEGIPEMPGAPEWKRLGKLGAVQLVSSLDRMDPEVAKKALEKYPDFSGAVSAAARDQHEAVEKAMAQNAESQGYYYAACNSVLESLKALLNDESLSFAQKRELVGQMKEVAGMMGEKDAENKRYLRAVLKLGALAAFGAALALFAALGGKARLEK